MHCRRQFFVGLKFVKNGLTKKIFLIVREVMGMVMMRVNRCKKKKMIWRVW